jgi:hypothetical protein
MLVAPCPDGIYDKDSRAWPEQVDHNRKKQSAEIQHSAKDHPILRFTPSG